MTAPPWREVARAYDQGAGGYDARHADSAATRARTARLDALLADAVRGAGRVLEIGVGTGRLLARTGARVAVGLDIAAAMLAQAQARGVLAVRADGHALPFAAASFDAIVSGKGSMRYLDPDRALAEVARVVRPGGPIALHLYGGATWSPRGTRAPHAGLWEPARTADLRATVARSGLSLVALQRFRSVRLWPYLVEIPELIDARCPVQLWSHAVVILRR